MLDVSCENYTVLFPLPLYLSGNVHVKMLYGTKVFYTYISGDEEELYGYDNYQASKITNGIKKDMKNVIGGDVELIKFCYGEKDVMDRDDKEWGLVHHYYDGTNLAEVLGNSQNNTAVISYVTGDIEEFSADDIINIGGENTDYIFLQARNSKAYSIIEDCEFHTFGDMVVGVDEMALFIGEYAVVVDGKKEYMKYDVRQCGDIYYMMIEGTYCNLTEIPLEDAYKLEVAGRAETDPIYRAYSVDTDARTLYVWIPQKVLFTKQTEPVAVKYDWQYYGNENEELQHYAKPACPIYNNNFFCASMYSRDQVNRKLIVYGYVRKE